MEKTMENDMVARISMGYIRVYCGYIGIKEK